MQLRIACYKVGRLRSPLKKGNQPAILNFMGLMGRLLCFPRLMKTKRKPLKTIIAETLKNSLVILVLLSLTACSFFKKKQGADKDAIARVNDDYLYASDIQGLTKGLKGKDSIGVLKSYADNWVRKKLLLQKAEENIPADDLGITKKVEEYRASLLLYEYEKALINKKLDTAVTQKESDAWYEKLKSDFPLEKDVYLLFFIKLKKDAHDIDNVRKWVNKQDDEETARKLNGYCREFATSQVLNQGIWYDKDNVIKNFPLTEYDIAALNSSKVFKEFKTENGNWFIKIGDVMKKDQPAPVEFIHDQIVKAIIEKRRLQLIEKIYDRIYLDGIKSKSFEILVK